MRRLLTVFGLIAAAWVAMGADLAQAQFGSRPVRIVFPFGAAGSGDALARLVAERMQAATGQPVLVDNRTGASGRIGVTFVKQSEPDGTTLLMAPFTLMLIYPAIYPNLSYDPMKDFVPVSQAATFEFALAVNKDIPVNTVSEFVAWVKEHPQKASFGTPGPGTLPHFLGAAFARTAGINLVHIAYRGAATAMSDVIGGQIPIGVLPVSDLLPQRKAGLLRVLATFDSKRSPFMPDVPTLKESGFDVHGNGWFAFYAPAKTPPATVERISKIIADALQSKGVKDRVRALGMTTTGTTPAELAELDRTDAALWVPIVKESGFKPDE